MFIRPHQGYGDIIYDQLNNNRLSEKIESIQYSTALAITGAIWGTSREIVSGVRPWIFERQLRWLRRLCYLYKVLSTKLPAYFYELIPPIINSHHNPGCYRALYCWTDLFQNSFLPFSINKWNKLDPDKIFPKKLLNFIRPSEKKYFQYLWPTRI